MTERYSFEDYKPATESQERALVIARNLVELASDSTIAGPALVVFSGKPGVGKTHLLESIKSGLGNRNVSYEESRGGKLFLGMANQNPNARVFLGDDVFSESDRLSAELGSASWSEINALNKLVLNDWYPNNKLIVLTSNFPLEAIVSAMKEFDNMGRTSSRLKEMAQRGADVPIEGDDYRSSSNVESLFN